MNTRFSIRPYPKGFTLLELTIAMALFALIALILYGAFDLSQRAVKKGEAAAEETQRLRMLESFLGEYVRSAYPYRESLREPSILFWGEEDRLTFISAVSFGLGGRGMSRVTLRWTDPEDGPGQIVVEEEMPVRPNVEGEPSGYKNSLVLQQGVVAFRIDYLSSQGEAREWVDRWDGAERKSLPLAVRLNFQGVGDEEAQWVFPIMMTVLAP